MLKTLTWIGPGTLSFPLYMHWKIKDDFQYLAEVLALHYPPLLRTCWSVRGFPGLYQHSLKIWRYRCSISRFRNSTVHLVSIKLSSTHPWLYVMHLFLTSCHPFIRDQCHTHPWVLLWSDHVSSWRDFNFLSVPPAVSHSLYFNFYCHPFILLLAFLTYLQGSPLRQNFAPAWACVNRSNKREKSKYYSHGQKADRSSRSFKFLWPAFQPRCLADRQC